jgi:hypothetical protein
MCYYYVYIHIAIGFFSKNIHKPNIKYKLQEQVHQPIHITHYVLGDIPYIIGGIAHLLGGMHIQISPIVTIFGEQPSINQLFLGT